MSKPKLNVVIFGDSGSGKSSAVNVLLGRDAAAVSDSAVGCTFDFQKYVAPTFNLFDTVGLSEGNMGTIKQSFAVKQLINLLKSLEDGVSLLVFVMEKGRIKKSLDENYKLFVEAICMSSVPIVLLITHCEMEPKPGVWWMENKKHFDQYGMTFRSVVCGCTMDPEKAPVPMQPTIKSLRDLTAKELSGAIGRDMLVPGWEVKGGWKNWFQSIVKTVLRLIVGWFGGSQALFPDDGQNFEDRLIVYFLQQDYEPLVARQMAKDIANSL